MFSTLFYGCVFLLLLLFFKFLFLNRSLSHVFVATLCVGPLGRSHDSDRYPPSRSSGFDGDRPRERERDFGVGRPDRESDDTRNR